MELKSGCPGFLYSNFTNLRDWSHSRVLPRFLPFVKLIIIAGLPSFVEVLQALSDGLKGMFFLV